jgi:hypothetical protein
MYFGPANLTMLVFVQIFIFNLRIGENQFDKENKDRIN